ncbi:hypothetical protein ABVK25_006179 [Lepraria finkii]|uniref:Uncharacterized protein n=1 Tax=Lepraria finkii TaxID=1340010 RepID=A0ABR4B6P3_9LECA
MTTATQRYISPSTYGPANMFAQSISCNLPKSDESVKVCGNGAPASRTIQPQQMEKQASRGANLRQLNTDESSFFDFDPPSNTGSPFQHGGFSIPGASGMPWGTDLNDFRPHHHQTLLYSFQRTGPTAMGTSSQTLPISSPKSAPPTLEHNMAR